MKTYSNKRSSFVGCRYTTRDLEILITLLDKKYVTTAQLHRLHFPQCHTQKIPEQRMRILRDREGVVRSLEQLTHRGEGRKCFIWALTEKGAQVVAYERGIDPKLIDVRPWADEEYSLQIKHLLLTTDVHIAVLQACASHGITLESWIDERELRSIQKMDKIKIPGLHGEDWDLPIPDAVFTIRIADKKAVYRLEVDRSTVDINPSLYEKRSIIKKARMYMALEASQYYQTEYEG